MAIRIENWNCCFLGFNVYHFLLFTCPLFPLHSLSVLRKSPLLQYRDFSVPYECRSQYSVVHYVILSSRSISTASQTNAVNFSNALINFYQTTYV